MLVFCECLFKLIRKLVIWHETCLVFHFVLVRHRINERVVSVTFGLLKHHKLESLWLDFCQIKILMVFINLLLFHHKGIWWENWRNVFLIIYGFHVESDIRLLKFWLDLFVFCVDPSNEVVFETWWLLFNWPLPICVQISYGLINTYISLVHLLGHKLDVFESAVWRGLGFLLLLPNGLETFLITSNHLRFGSLMTVHLAHRVLLLRLQSFTPTFIHVDLFDRSIKEVLWQDGRLILSGKGSTH